MALLPATCQPNHDNAWLMIAAQQWLKGGILGDQVRECNPPLSVLFSVPPAFVTDLLQIDYQLSLSLYVELLAAIVGIALYLINVRSGVTGRTSLLVSLGTIVVFTLGQGREFGERDGVTFLLLLPLGLSVTREIAGDRTQPLITQAALVSLAAVGCMLKPFYVLGLGGLFLLRFLKAPSWKQVVRFELPLLIGLGILYILAVFVFFPQWIAMTRTTVTVYSSLNAPLSDFKPILLAHGLAMLVSLGMIALAWSAGRDIRYAGVFLVFALGLELGAAIQLKPWAYHFLPGLLAIATAPLLAFASPNPGRALAVRPLFGTLIAGVVSLAVLFVTGGYFHRNDRDPDFRQLVAIGRNGPVLVLTSAMDHVFPHVNDAKVVWASRSPVPLASLKAQQLRSGTPAQRELARQITLGDVKLITEDIAHWRPAVIAFDREDYIFTSRLHGNWMTHFTREPIFQESLKNYEYVGVRGRYDVFRRIDLAL